ncbi:MAG: hypothetical protein KDA41_05580, partial [Planctomycetales bacterium]|nr:hypothetical protein [Planctomycetales bacterium]
MQKLSVGRPQLPAWLMSVCLHLGALVLLALVLHGPAASVSPEPARHVGVVLARSADSTEYFSPDDSPEPSDSPASAPTAANAGLASPAGSPSELEALSSSPALPSD